MEPGARARKRDHLPALDGLRGLAITLVFLFHSLAASFPSDHLAWAGWHRAWPISLSFFVLMPAYLGAGGVALFCVVSGFCIHWSHQRLRNKDWRTFFARRFFRIYPPYLVALLSFAFCFSGTRLAFDSRHDVDQVLSHLFLLHNNLGPGFLYGVNPSFWSIGTEVQLYLLYPVLLWVADRGGWSAALWLTGGLEIILRGIWGGMEMWPRLSPWLAGDPVMYWFSWSLGAALADASWHARSLPMSRFPIWIWPALAVGSYFIRPLEGFGFMLWALATTAILARVLSGQATLWRPFLSGNFLRRIGVISYSIYLLHQPLLGWVAGMGPGKGGNSWELLAGCLLAAPVILLSSWGFYRLVELPSVAAGKWVLGRRMALVEINPASDGNDRPTVLVK